MRCPLALLDLSADARHPPVAPTEAEQRLLTGGLWLSCAAMAFLALVHLVNLFAFDPSWDFLNAGHDGGLFTFASAAATVLCGGLALALVAVWPRRTRLLWVLAVLLAYLGLDDMYAGHERIAVRLDLDVLGIEDTGRVLWPLAFLPLLGATLAGLAAVASALPDHARRAMRAGLALLVAAVGLEMASILIVNAGYEDSTALYELEVAVEEAAELGGWMMIAVGLGVALLAGGPGQRR